VPTFFFARLCGRSEFFSESPLHGQGHLMRNGQALPICLPSRQGVRHFVIGQGNGFLANDFAGQNVPADP
jgi:hypothetical protein